MKSKWNQYNRLFISEKSGLSLEFGGPLDSHVYSRDAEKYTFFSSMADFYVSVSVLI